jgi:hypothetical protein
LTPVEIKGVIDNCSADTRAIYEVALQLAELNAKLTPDAIYELLETLDRKRDAVEDERRSPR